MTVNPVVDKPGGQEAAGAINYVVMNELNKIDKDKNSDSVDKTVKSKESYVSKLAEDGNANKTGMEMLSRLASQLAASGIDLSPENFSKRVEQNMGREYDLLFEGSELQDDLAEIRDAAQRVMQRKGGQNQNQNQSQNMNLPMDQETTSILKEYMAIYAQYLVNGSAELKKLILKLEGKLKGKGLSMKELHSIQMGIRKSIRAEVAAQIKETFFKKIMSPQKSLEFVIHERSLNDVLDFAFLNHRIGGWDFGGYNESLQGTTDRAIEEVRGEVKDFLSEELQRSITERHLSGKENMDKGIKELLKLGQKVGFNTEEFIQSWQRKKLDLGLFHFDVPERPTLLGAGVASDGGEKRKKSGYEYSREDEKEILLNRLRALYMRRALKGDIRTVIETSFKMRKLKNGLIKLGLTMDEFGEVKKEGRAVARLKLMEMLKEVFLERATLYELSGPAFKLIKRKIKGILKNLGRLGMELTTVEIESIRDSANRYMYDVARAELEAVEAMMRGERHPVLEKKQKHLMKLIARLKDESDIEGSDDPRIAEIIRREMENIDIIKEAV